MLGFISEILLPFLIPYLIASGYGVLQSNKSKLSVARHPSYVWIWAVSLVIGIASITVGLIAGAFAHGLSVALSGRSAAGDLVSELQFSTGFPSHTVTFLVVAAVFILGLSAIGGSLAWALLRHRYPGRPVTLWILENALLWGVGFMLALVLALLGGAYTPCISPLIVLALAGLAIGYAYGDHLHKQAILYVRPRTP